ncbi:hypothetical protein HHL24_27205 [Paraburkholderia sp. RP-4-7]|jgi:hypothetical protein|uniref:Uncharacterized protein n=1 Tax=Paraburkholderia polaris TaxID=2728848 RepID=A0A848IPA4_9BURK|nr:hypothetical protein [Paraburkholderia polaris]NMM01614.1 hypothetical protein [Paraburkholderia polaris]
MFKKTKVGIVGALLACAGVGLSMDVFAHVQTVEFEVVFKDHQGKESDPVRVELPISGAPETMIRDVPNTKSPLPDLLKLAVVERDSDGRVSILAEEKASRVVQIENLVSDDGQRVQLPNVADMHGFEAHSLTVGEQCTVADGREVLSVVRRVR